MRKEVLRLEGKDERLQKDLVVTTASLEVSKKKHKVMRRRGSYTFDCSSYPVTSRDVVNMDDPKWRTFERLRRKHTPPSILRCFLVDTQSGLPLGGKDRSSTYDERRRIHATYATYRSVFHSSSDFNVTTLPGCRFVHMTAKANSACRCSRLP